MITIVPYDDSNDLLDYGGGAITVGSAAGLAQFRNTAPFTVQARPLAVTVAGGIPLTVCCRIVSGAAPGCCCCVGTPCGTPTVAPVVPPPWGPMTMGPGSTFTPTLITTAGGAPIFVLNIPSPTTDTVPAALQAVAAGNPSSLGFHVYLVQPDPNGTAPPDLLLTGQRVFAIPIASWNAPSPPPPPP